VNCWGTRMSRRSRDDDRAESADRAPDRQVPDRPHTCPDEVAARGLTLPRGDEREIVAFRSREYSLNGSETRALELSEKRGQTIIPPVSRFIGSVSY